MIVLLLTALLIVLVIALLPGLASTILAILGSLRERQATTVVIASHDPLPRRGWPDRVLTMEDGTLA